MRLELGYGTGTQIIKIPKANIIDILEPNSIEIGLTGLAE